MTKQDCCPKCGSTDGIRYCLRAIDRRVFIYGGEDYTSEIEIVGKRPKTGICDACGLRVPLPGAKE